MGRFAIKKLLLYNLAKVNKMRSLIGQGIEYDVKGGGGRERN